MASPGAGSSASLPAARATPGRPGSLWLLDGCQLRVKGCLQAQHLHAGRMPPPADVPDGVGRAPEHTLLLVNAIFSPTSCVRLSCFSLCQSQLGEGKTLGIGSLAATWKSHIKLLFVPVVQAADLVVFEPAR